MFIGQTHLKSKLNALMNSRVGLVIAPDNYGKTYFVKCLANKIGLDYVYIEPKVKDIALVLEDSSKNTLYHVNEFNRLRHQGVSRLLKFLEEDLNNNNMIVLTSNTNFVPNTILSRCTVMRFSKYTIDELKQVKTIPDYLYYLYDTPTKLMNLDNDIMDVVTKVRDFITEPETFNTFCFREYDINLLIDILILELDKSKYYHIIERLRYLQKNYNKTDYIPNWQKVSLLFGDLRYEFI